MKHYKASAIKLEIYDEHRRSKLGLVTSRHAILVMDIKENQWLQAKPYLLKKHLMLEINGAVYTVEDFCEVRVDWVLDLDKNYPTNGASVEEMRIVFLARFIPTFRSLKGGLSPKTKRQKKLASEEIVKQENIKGIQAVMKNNQRYY